MSQAGEQVGEVLGRPVTASAGRRAWPSCSSRAAVAARLLRLPVDEQAAAAAGLSCGGTVTVALHQARRVPARFWQAVAGRPSRSRWSAGSASTTAGHGPRSHRRRDGADGRRGRRPRATPARRPSRPRRRRRRLLAGGRHRRPGGRRRRRHRWSSRRSCPVTRLVVVGAGDLADALDRQAALLGWRPEVRPTRPRPLEAIGRLGPADGVVVLSHDRDVDVPGAGRRPGAGGRLHRRARLPADPGRPPGTPAGRRCRRGGAGRRVQGPAGLDLGGRAPEEIALAICAEMLAVRLGPVTPAARASGDAADQPRW